MHKFLYYSLLFNIVGLFTIAILLFNNHQANESTFRSQSPKYTNFKSTMEVQYFQEAPFVGNNALTVMNKQLSELKVNSLHITAIGDSLTQGVGDESKSGGYIGVLDKFLKKNLNGPFTIKQFGKRGNRSDQLLKRIKEDKEITESLKKADIVMITIGANDIMKITKENIFSLSYDDFAMEQKGYQKRLTDIFKEIRKRNSTAHIYLIGLFNPFAEYFGDIPELERIIDDWNWIGRLVVKADYNATFIPIKNLFINPSENLLSEDNFHPNERGYELIGNTVVKYLEKSFWQE